MPPRRSQPSPRLQELRELAADPAAQAALAQSVLAVDKDVQAIRAALEVLQQHPTPAARPVLRERFEHYAADGVRRDTGTYLRAAILQALRPIALRDDLSLLERAAGTFEFLPPGRSEEGALLRSAALVTMDAVDPRLAAYHCIRLLADRYTSRLSGEPAVTAVRVLAAQGNDSPLYYYALHQPDPQSDVLSECLKNLAKLPAALAAGLIEKYGASNDEVVLVGLLDMVLEAGDSPFIHEFLTRTDKYAVYHYLVTRLMDRPTRAALDELGRQAQTERDPRKLSLLEEALLLGRADPITQAALAAVRRSKQESAHGGPRAIRASGDHDTD
jgi:hypothetical protein